MIKPAKVSTADRDEHYKAQVAHYLRETRKILKQLAAERAATARRHRHEPRLMDEVNAILRG